MTEEMKEDYWGEEEVEEGDCEKERGYGRQLHGMIEEMKEDYWGKEEVEEDGWGKEKLRETEEDS